MKSYIKGVITGLAGAIALTFTFAMADNIEVALNGVRLNINGVDTVQWGEDITASDGTDAPSSLLYNGTTYLPMRKLGELLGKKIYWNGDSATVSVTGGQSDIKKLAEKTDAEGNVWTYYTFKADDKSYIGVKDNARGFERVYGMDGDAVKVTDNAIYYVHDQYYCLYRIYESKVKKLPFYTDSNSQDGEDIKTIRNAQNEWVVDGDWMFYIGGEIGGNGGNYSGSINAYNIITGETAVHEMGYRSAAIDLEIADSKDDVVTLSYKKASYSITGDDEYSEAGITFDRSTKEFK